jgi:hypothetical protein
LLSILGAGFAQGLYALDASDEDAQSPWKMIHLLIQALLQYGFIVAILLASPLTLMEIPEL